MPASLADIDRNFAVETACNLPVRFYPARVSPFSIHGLYDPQAGAPYRRLPADVAAATNDGVSSLALHTSGGRVRFKTDSPYVVLKACMPHVDLMPHMTLVGSSGLDVYVTTPDGERYQGSCKISWGNDAAIRATEEHGYVNEVHFDPTLSGMKDVTVNMPLYNCLDELYIGLAPDAKLEAAEGYRDLPPTVYYGSSITQGGCASRPGNNYCAILSRAFGVDFLNLGFSGSARGEEAIADYIAGLSMSAFVYAYDHNAPTVEHLDATHERMYLTIRAAHPHLPVIFITRPKPYYNEEEKARRAVVLRTYENALTRGERVYFVDGEHVSDILGGDGITVDGCHPNDLGFACVAAALRPVFAEIYGK
jgi:hypothetical protein